MKLQSRRLLAGFRVNIEKTEAPSAGLKSMRLLRLQKVRVPRSAGRALPAVVNGKLHVYRLTKCNRFDGMLDDHMLLPVEGHRGVVVLYVIGFTPILG